MIEGNVVGGCVSNGIALDSGLTDSGPTETRITGNWIGTNTEGDNLGNPGSGVVLVQTTNTQIVGNTIAFNRPGGVSIGAGSTGSVIQGNSIYDNGIGIGLGADVWQDSPVLSAAYAGTSTVVQGTLHSTPNTIFTLDFYANAAPDSNGYYEGPRYLGSTTVTTDANGYIGFAVSGLAPAGLVQYRSS